MMAFSFDLSALNLHLILLALVFSFAIISDELREKKGRENGERKRDH